MPIRPVDFYNFAIENFILMKEKKFLIVLVSLLLALPSAAQLRVPDNEQIQSAVVSPSSEFYYPKLMLRYDAGDTTLTLTDYHHLYYGYAWQDSYRPLDPIPAEDDLLMALDMYREKMRGINELKPDTLSAFQIIAAGRQVMKADPFSPKNLNFLIFAYQMIGDTVNARINSDRYYKVMETIRTSGTGLKEDSPWHVLKSGHAVDVMNSLEMPVRKRTLKTRTVEYMDSETVRAGIRGYYFDFGRAYWRKPNSLPKQEKEKRVSGFEINGIPVGGKRQ